MAKAVHGRPTREPSGRQVLARWKRGGLSVRAFCGAEGLNPMTFCWRISANRSTAWPPSCKTGSAAL
jgi:hypothetical protein